MQRQLYSKQQFYQVLGTDGTMLCAMSDAELWYFDPKSVAILRILIHHRWQIEKNRTIRTLTTTT